LPYTSQSSYKYLLRYLFSTILAILRVFLQLKGINSENMIYFLYQIFRVAYRLHWWNLCQWERRIPRAREDWERIRKYIAPIIEWSSRTTSWLTLLQRVSKVKLDSHRVAISAFKWKTERQLGSPSESRIKN